MRAGGHIKRAKLQHRVAGGAAAAQHPKRWVSPAEEAVWLSDRPGDPRVVVLMARLSRPVDRQLLATALKVVTGRDDHFLSYPTCKGPLARRFVWSPVEGIDRAPLVLTDVDDAPLPPLIERLRLAVERMRPGIAVGVVRQDGADVAILVIHHALTDGLGALEILSEILALAGLTADIPPVRDEIPASAQAPEAASAASLVRRRLPLAPSRLAPEIRPAQASSAGYGYASTSVQPVRPPAFATVNDALVAGTMLAVQRWNAAHHRGSKRIAVHMPISARVIGQEPGGKQNATGQFLVETSPAERGLSRLLANVAEQTRPAKSTPGSHASSAERAVMAAMWLPAQVRRGLLRRVGRAMAACIMPTVTVSNLGRVDALFPGLPGATSGVEKLLFFTTAGMPQGITVTASGLHGRLHLGLTYSRRLLSDGAADAFLELVVEGMELVAESAAPARTPVE